MDEQMSQWNQSGVNKLGASVIYWRQAVYLAGDASTSGRVPSAPVTTITRMMLHRRGLSGASPLIYHCVICCEWAFFRLTDTVL